MTSLRGMCAAAALVTFVITPAAMTIGVPATAHAGCVSPQVAGGHKGSNGTPCIQNGGSGAKSPGPINPPGSWNGGIRGGGSISIPAGPVVYCNDALRCYQPQ